MIGTAYQQLPLWSPSQGLASGSQPVDQGYDVTINTTQGLRRSAALGHTNATLADGDFQHDIFVAGISLDSAQSGTTAQSQLTRDWYAHNFVQPSFTVIGWSLNQQDYGTMVEFIHAAQFKAINNSAANITQLAIAGRTGGASGMIGDRGTDGGRFGDHTTPAVVISNPNRLMLGRHSDPPSAPDGTYYNQTIRGSHKPVVAQGYVTTMPRIHKRFQGAVQWEFQFVVAVMLQGLYDEQAITGTTHTTPMWQAMLAAAQKDGVFVVTKSVLKENKASLAYAASHKDSLPGAETGGSSSGGSTPTGGTGTGAQWRIVASAEDDPPGAQASCGPLPADRRGHSVLSISGLSSDAGTAGQALSPGKLWPCSAKLIVTNPANNRSVTISHVDNGAGSSFRPIIGLYPQTRSDLGLDNSGQYSVIIQAATGAPEPHPVRGTRI